MIRTGILALVSVMVLAAQVLAGDWTGNGFIYKPALGARGAQEKLNFDSGQDRLDARLGKEIWVGDPKYGTTVQSAITNIASNNATLRVPAGTYTISDNLIIPVNVTLRVERGAILSIAAGKTLTINGGLEAGLYQVFSGAGNAAFGTGSNPQLKPEWWGAKGDDSTDCTAAMQAAINAAYRTKTLTLSNGTYRVTGTSGSYALTVSCNVRGQSPNTSIIKNVGTGSAMLIDQLTYYTRWDNFSVMGNAASQDGIVTGTDAAMSCDYSSFTAVDSLNHGRHGLVMRNTWATRFIDCKFHDNGGLGVYITSVNGDHGLANATQFINCESRWNGGTGNASTDYTKGGVRIEGCNKLTWLGGVLEGNNAWGFIIGEDAGAYPNYSVNINGVFLENMPRSEAASTIGGLIRANNKWNNLTVENCYGSYGGKAGVTAYGLYILNTLLRDTFSPYTAPSFVNRNNLLTRGAAGTNIPMFIGPDILERHGITRQNLLSNSGFGVWSNSALQNVGAQISVTSITAGVCTTTNTQGLAVGKLVQFGAGGSTANKVYEVTGVTVNASFTLHDTSITDATAVTGYEVTPGCIAADSLGPDGWVKAYTTTRPNLYREFSGSNTKDFYALKVVSTESAGSHGLLQNLNKTDNGVSANAFQHLQGRTVALGCWVKADAVGVANLQIYDRIANPSTGTLTQSRTNLTTDWEWIEFTRTFPSATLDRANIQLSVNTTGHTVYFSKPMLVYGDAVGVDNYAAKENETIYLDAPFYLTNYNAATAVVNKSINLQAESNGKLPKGVKAASLGIQVNETGTVSNGDGVQIKNASGSSIQMRVMPQVAGLALMQNGLVSCNADGNLWAVTSTTAGSLTYYVRADGVQLR